MVDSPSRKERRLRRKLAKKAEARDPIAKAARAFEDGMALHQKGHLAKAEAAYLTTVAADGNFAEAHLNLGVVLHAQGKFDAALDAIKRALALNPDMAEAHYALAAVDQDQDNPEDAAAGFQRALAIDPDFILAVNGLGIAEQKLGNWDDAAEAFRRALTLNPGFAEAANNLGILRHKQGRLDDAIASFERAIGTRPDYAKAHRNYSHVLLAAGRLKDGWREFPWRWQCSDFPTPDRNFPYPRWSGEAIDGKQFLVWGEQGVGDEVHFASMVPDLIDQGAGVILECDRRLVPLFTRSFPGVTCIAREDPPAVASETEIDFQLPTADLGQWLRSQPGDFPDRRSYLVADEGQSKKLKAQYRTGGGDVLIGLAWISKNPEVGFERSLTLMDWAGLAALPGITFVDLQYGDTEAERKAFLDETGTAILHDDGVDQMADLDAFAAQVAAMDLIISIDNSTVHMAGALATPVWTLLPFQSDWRWMTERQDSPWYPEMRLFRQTEPGAWADVIAQVESALKGWLPAG